MREVTEIYSTSEDGTGIFRKAGRPGFLDLIGGGGFLIYFVFYMGNVSFFFLYKLERNKYRWSEDGGWNYFAMLHNTFFIWTFIFLFFD